MYRGSGIKISSERNDIMQKMTSPFIFEVLYIDVGDFLVSVLAWQSIKTKGCDYLF